MDSNKKKRHCNTARGDLRDILYENVEESQKLCLGVRTFSKDVASKWRPMNE